MPASKEAIADALALGDGREVTQDDADAFNAIAATLTGEQSDDADEMAAIRALLLERFGVTGPGPRHWRVYQVLLAGAQG